MGCPGMTSKEVEKSDTPLPSTLPTDYWRVCVGVWVCVGVCVVWVVVGVVWDVNSWSA